MTPGPEFKDLLEIYTKQIEDLKENEESELLGLQRDMRDYLLYVDKREEVEEKLKKLKYKMGFAAGKKVEGNTPGENIKLTCTTGGACGNS